MSYNLLKKEYKKLDSIEGKYHHQIDYADGQNNKANHDSMTQQNYSSFKVSEGILPHTNYYNEGVGAEGPTTQDMSRGANFPFDYQRGSNDIDSGVYSHTKYHSVSFDASKTSQVPQVGALESFNFEPQYGPGESSLNAQYSPVKGGQVIKPEAEDILKLSKNGARSSSSSLTNNLSNAKKRARRSDHAIHGDDGDSELKSLAHEANKIPFSELALKVRVLDKDESSRETDDLFSSKKITKERRRQVFGMVWLFNSCENFPTAVVPRNRIYARYVQVCADHLLKPLSPASFGKLVRILFPSLTTRRLGMRGQSKYHYCGIRLIGDQSTQSNVSTSSNSPALTMDSPQSSVNANTPKMSDISSEKPELYSQYYEKPSDSIISEEFFPIELAYIPNLMTLLEDSFVTGDSNVQMMLPSIYPYLCHDVDYDIANTLYSLYKVHCDSLFEFLRYMQVNKLLSSFSSFNGILTAPVLKLYTDDSLIGWVTACDSILYKNMLRMLIKIRFFVVPDIVISSLKHISKYYLECLSKALQGKASHRFMKAKITNARKFITSLSRFIKVLETGSAVNRVLNNFHDKKAMVADWLSLDIKEIILREVPWTKANVDSLLSAFNIDFADILNALIDKAPHEIMIMIARFITELPSRIKDINARFFTLVLGNFFTTCLREISLKGGEGFGTWWILRCWVDEYIAWYFELGGYFQKENLANDTIEGVPSVHSDIKETGAYTYHVSMGADSNEEMNYSKINSFDLLKGDNYFDLNKEPELIHSITFDNENIEEIT